MTVTVTKPQATLRELLAGLKKRTGLFGEQVMRAETANDFYNVVGDKRNLIINGDFRISQRGTYTSATALTGSSTYYLDRFKMFESSTSSTFQHKLDQKLADGSYANTLNITATAANSIPVIQYFVEEYKTVWGKTFTVSFWYKSNKPWSYNIYNGTTQWHYQVPSSEGVWAKHSQTITLPENGVNLRFELYRYGAPGSLVSGDYFEFTKMQLELGSIATPFEIRLYATELALCKRYYHYIGGTYGELAFVGVASSSTNGQTVVTYPVEMRAAPTVSVTGTWAWLNQAMNGSYVWTSTSSTFTNARSTQFSANTSSGLVQGQGCIAQCDSSPGSRIVFNAEF